MPQLFYILFGFLFTVAVAWSLGRLLFQVLGLQFKRQEQAALAFVTGSSLLSLFVFLCCSAGIARKGVFLGAGLALLAYAFHRRLFSPSALDFPPLAPLWKIGLPVIGALFTWFYFINALAPEYSPDGSSYHLGLIARYLRARGFEPITTNIYANLSQGVEMLFLWAFAFGRHSAAALVHFAFLLTLPVLILSYGRRIGHPAAGAAAALFVFASPVVGVDGSVAYNDVAVAAIVFSVFYLLQLWDQDRNWKLLIPIGLLAGFSYASKYTAFLAVPYALGFVLWKTGLRRSWKPLIVVSLAAVLMMAPWLLKNTLVLGNPFSPFLNAVFPNPNVHVSFEKDYAAQLRTYGLASRAEIPREILLRGDRLTGLFGPLFLLAPLALFALRRSPGRRLLFAALLFALTYAGNIGTRFLIPTLPFLALAMALALEPLRFVLPLLALAHAVASWPPVLSRYCAPTAWRLAEVPLAAALRRLPEEQFLIRKLPEYLIARAIERHTPPGAIVYSFGQVAEAYTTRTILVNFQGALNERLMRTLWEPLVDDFQPRHARVFRYPPGSYRRLRVVQTERAEPDIWAITEVHAYHGGVELPRARWRATARPNPWYASLALDGSPVTQWRAWQFLVPGQFYEVDLGEPVPSDEVRVITSADHWKVELRLEGEDPAGRTHVLVPKSKLEFVTPPPGLRAIAMEELKAHRIGYLLLHEGSFGQQDFRDRSADWGIELLEHVHGADLYRIR